MQPITLGVACLALLATSTPAQSREPAREVPTAAPAVNVAGAASPSKAAKPKRYCANFTMSESRIPRKICKSREEWIKDGADPDQFK